MKTDETCNVSKGITVRSEVKPGYLEVTLRGEFNLEEIEHIGTQIFDFCCETNLEKVLVDARKIMCVPFLHPPPTSRLSARSLLPIPNVSAVQALAAFLPGPSIIP